jgi:hypothetical protein
MKFWDKGVYILNLLLHNYNIELFNNNEIV